MSETVARRRASASSRSVAGSAFGPGQMLRAKTSHSARMGSTFSAMKSASRTSPLRFHAPARSHVMGGDHEDADES
jgi:hypothetical protein